MTAYDVFGFSTRIIHNGDIATNMCASCCFPGLFQPVYLNGRPHIDGGVFDSLGLMSLPNIPTTSKLIVNVVMDALRISSIEDSIPTIFLEQGAILLTIVLNGLCLVHPFNMDSKGRESYLSAKMALDRALRGEVEYSMQECGDSQRHWVVYLDCENSQTLVADEEANRLLDTKHLAAIVESKAAVTEAKNKSSTKKNRASNKKSKYSVTKSRKRGRGGSALIMK